MSSRDRTLVVPERIPTLLVSRRRRYRYEGGKVPINRVIAEVHFGPLSFTDKGGTDAVATIQGL